MRTAIVGGGPGGLYLSLLLKRLDPAHDVVVYERNAPDDTFGFGVVFSDETLAAFEAADPESFEEITREFVRWSEIDVHFRGRGEFDAAGGVWLRAVPGPPARDLRLVRHRSRLRVVHVPDRGDPARRR